MRRGYGWLIGLTFFGAVAMGRMDQNVHPILLVPGLWYKYAKLVEGQRVWDSFTHWLVDEGFPREHIYVLDYLTIASIPSINARLNSQMEAIFEKYPPSTTFDVFAHSLGGFVALYAMMENGHSDRFRKFVSLAGIPQGWDGPFICRLGLCGLAHPPLIPYHSRFVERFLWYNASAIQALDKCSLFSPNDELVRPYDAGRFEDGTNVETPGLHHMDMVWSKTSFDAVVNHCYQGHIVP